MRLSLLTLYILLCISSISAQSPFNLGAAQTNAPIPQAATMPTQPPYQAWPTNQFQLPVNTLAWNSGAAQIPLTYTQPTPNVYPQAPYQQQPLPTSIPISGAQRTNPAAATPNAVSFTGFLSPEQIQQLALQASMPTLSQWAGDSAQNILARSRGILNNDPVQLVPTQQAAVMYPPALQTLLSQQQAAAASSFNFAAPPATSNTPSNMPAAPQMMPNNGQFIPPAVNPANENPAPALVASSPAN